MTIDGMKESEGGWKIRIFHPVPHAALIAGCALMVLLPYWWLAVRWFSGFKLSSDTTFAFTSVMLMLVLITVDALFLFVYFHDAGKIAIAERTRKLIAHDRLLRRELNLNRALADLAGALITQDHTIDEIAAMVLSSARELTGSSHGFVSVVDEKTGEMTSPTLAAIAADRGSTFDPAGHSVMFSPGADGTYPGLLGNCLNTRRPFFTNTPDLHQAPCKMSDSHFSVTSFLAAPALVGEAIVGQIALANAPEGYSDWELTAVTRLTELYTLAIQRERITSSLRSKQKQLSLIIDGVPAMIGYVDADARYLYVNQAYAEWYGYPQDSFIGRAVQEVLNDDLYQRSRYCYEKVLAGESVKMEYQATGRDTRQHILHVSFVPHRDEEGRVVAFFMLIQDITDLKRAEEGLRQANRKLKLLSGITRHDIQNQVTALLGYIDLTMEMTADSNLQMIIRRENELVAQIRSEITFTKEYEEVGVHSPEWQKVAGLIEHVLLTLPAGGVEVHPVLGDLEIYADPLLLKVIYNLIENSLRHGRRVREIRFSAHPGDNKTLILVYEDDGEGIPSGQKEEIFRKGVGSNTGLGLFLTRDVLAITGITIIESGIYGEGARFEMTIPDGGYRHFSLRPVDKENWE